MTEKPFTVLMLADRWSCSTDAVYALIREKKLPAFRLGGKLLRVRAEDVAAWESAGESTQSEATGSANSRGKPSSVGGTKKGLTAEGLASILR